MATFAEMKTWVSKRLQDPNNTAVSSADVGDLINQALNYWKNVRFNFNERTITDTLVAQDPTLPLPVDWLVPATDEAIVIEYSGIRYVLKKLVEPMYNGVYLSNGIGQPWWYSKQADEGYQVYPIPDRDYTVRFFYVKNYDNFAADSDTNDFSEDGQYLLQYTAAAYGSRDFRQDMAMYQAFMQRALDEEQNLLVTTRKDNATGSLVTYSALN